MSENECPLGDVAVPAVPGEGFALDGAVSLAEKERRRRETVAFYGGVSMETFADQFKLTGVDRVKLLKRWVEKGRQASPVDLPPFQRPHELAAWWRRMQTAGIMCKSPPQWMILLEQTSPENAAPAAAVETATATPTPAPAISAMPDCTPDFALPTLDADAGAGERQLFEFAQGWLQEMESARRSNNSTRFFRAWNEYKAINKELRAWQKDRQRERVQSGELLEVEREKEALGLIFSAIGKTFMAALDRLVAASCPELDATARRQRIMPYRDRVFSALKGTRFQTAVPVEELDKFLAA